MCFSFWCSGYGLVVGHAGYASEVQQLDNVFVLAIPSILPLL